MSDSHYRLLRLIETNPELSQRDLACDMGVSLGVVIGDYGFARSRESGKIVVRPSFVPHFP